MIKSGVQGSNWQDQNAQVAPRLRAFTQPGSGYHLMVNPLWYLKKRTTDITIRLVKRPVIFRDRGISPWFHP